MKSLKIFYFFAAISLFAPVTSSCQNFWNSTYWNFMGTAVSFINQIPDARSGGMGGAGVASSPDIHSLHWNPAKYAFFEDEKFREINAETGDTTLVQRNLFAAAGGLSSGIAGEGPNTYLGLLNLVWRPDHKQAIALSSKLHSQGEINFTDGAGEFLFPVKPVEVAIDVAYARKLGKNFSAGVSVRYIRSDLTQGQFVGSIETKPGQTITADLSAFYTKNLEFGKMPSIFSAGLNLSNIGDKVTYSDELGQNFIPVNLRLGPSLTIFPNPYHQLSFLLDFNKLLVPSPPIYLRDDIGQLVIDDYGNYMLESGRYPNRPMLSRMFGSFSDAPGGFSEELKEVSIAAGAEYWFRNTFAFRAGYFYEHRSKGNRKFITFGAGYRYRFALVDMAYLLPTEEASPVSSLFRVSIGFIF